MVYDPIFACLTVVFAKSVFLEVTFMTVIHESSSKSILRAFESLMRLETPLPRM